MLSALRPSSGADEVVRFNAWYVVLDIPETKDIRVKVRVIEYVVL